MHIKSVTLRGNHVQLDPLAIEQVPALWAAGNHEDIWRYMPFAVRTEDDFHQLVQRMLDLAEAGHWLGFALRSIEEEMKPIRPPHDSRS